MGEAAFSPRAGAGSTYEIFIKFSGLLPVRLAMFPTICFLASQFFLYVLSLKHGRAR
jgi:hypothetical protein